MSIAEKLTTIAENEPKVYEKGKTDFGYKKSVSGSYLYIDDINQNEKTIDAKVTSTNLFDINSIGSFYPEWAKNYGKVEDGVISIGLPFANNYLAFEASGKLKAGTYTLSFDNLFPDTTTDSRIVSSVLFTDGTKTTFPYINWVYTRNQWVRYKDTFTITEDKEIKGIYLGYFGANAQDFTTVQFKNIMIAEGYGSEYTHFVYVANTKLLATEKNVIPFPYPKFSGSYKANGITATLQEDGGIVLNGTATAYCYINLANVFLGSAMLCDAWATDNKDFIASGGGKGGAVSVRYDGNNLVFVMINTGTVCDNFVAYPQIERGQTKTAFELGDKNKYYTVNSDGSVDGIETITPEMNILSTSKNVTINTEYYADSEKIIDELTDTIISLGGDI